MPNPQNTHPPPPRFSQTGLTACHHCDQLHQLPSLQGSLRASCARCGSTLLRHSENAVDKVVALNLSALVLLAIVNSFPLLSLKVGGRVQDAGLLSATRGLFDAGQWELGLLVVLTSLVFPLFTALGWLYMLLPLRLGWHPPGLTWVYRWTHRLSPWSLIAVFMLGVLIAIFKLLDLATVIPGIALIGLAALILVSTAARLLQSPHLIWPLLGPEIASPVTHPQALQHGFHSCHHCGLLVPDDQPICPRCDSHLHARKPDSINRTLALLSAAVILFIPANVYPVMTVIWLGSGEPSTILGGVVALIDGGMLPLALVVLVASIVVPAFKLLVFGYLLLSIRRGSNWRPVDRTRLYRVTELIGAWSMVDVYLVAILTAVVQMDILATVRPGLGASFFAAVVVLTMLAAHSFDPRLIWDNQARQARQD